MNDDLVKYFEENECKLCKDADCKRKPHRMIKCAILYLYKLFNEKNG